MADDNANGNPDLGNLFDNNQGDNNNHELGQPAPVPHAFNLADALSIIRKYNGRTSVVEWINRFETDVLAFGITFKYAITSLDRFFIEDASFWWSSVSHNYVMPALNRDEADFRQVWENVADDMREFFDHSALQAVNRKKNKDLIWQHGDEVQGYVTRKLALLKEIDANMPEHKRVQNLIRGLQPELRVSFSCQDIDNVGQFLRRLRKYSEVVEESKPKAASNSRSSSRNSNEQSHSIRAFTRPQSSGNDPNKERLCYKCNKPGHIARQCPEISAQHPSNTLPRQQQQGHQTNNFPNHMHNNGAFNGNGRGRGRTQHNGMYPYSYPPPFFFPQNYPPFPMAYPPNPFFPYRGQQPRYSNNNQQLPPPNPRHGMMSIQEPQNESSANDQNNSNLGN